MMHKPSGHWAQFSNKVVRRWCKVGLQDVMNSSPPNKQWVHSYPVRKNDQGRSYATLEVEFSYRIDMPPDFVQNVVDTALHPEEAARSRASDEASSDRKADGKAPISEPTMAAHAEDLSFVERHFPTVYDLLYKTRTLDRGDHIVIGTLVSFLLGWFRRDSAFLVPVAVLLSRLESVHVRQAVQKGLQRLGNADERLKQVARWHKASAIRKVEVAPECRAQLLNLLRQNVPQILIDAQAQALSGVLEHFWPCYSDWYPPLEEQATLCTKSKKVVSF